MSCEWICAALTRAEFAWRGARPAWARCWFTRSMIFSSCADMPPEAAGTPDVVFVEVGSVVGGVEVGGAEAGGLGIGTTTTGLLGFDWEVGPPRRWARLPPMTFLWPWGCP